MKTSAFALFGALALFSQSAPATKPISINLREGTNMAAALSPDGRTLIIDLQGSLWTLPASGGPAKRVTDEYLDARQPAWAPDNRRVAFQGYADGVWHIYVMNADGSGVRAITSGPFDDREPSWSRDGNRIAFSSDRSGNYDVFDLDVASGTVRQLTNNPANDYAPAYSPVNATIAFVSEREDRRGVWALDTATATERSIAPAAGAVSAPSWNPDGSRVIYNVIANNRSNLVIDGREITGDEDVFPFRAQWISADRGPVYGRRQDQDARRRGRRRRADRVHRVDVVHAHTLQGRGARLRLAKRATRARDYGARHFARWDRSRVHRAR